MFHLLQSSYKSSPSQSYLITFDRKGRYVYVYVIASWDCLFNLYFSLSLILLVSLRIKSRLSEPPS